MTTAEEKNLTTLPTIRHGMSWADQQDSPGWAAKAPPKFAEEMPEIVLDEQEYDRSGSAELPRTSSAAAISVFVGGLEYGLGSKDLEDFFVAQGCRVSRVRVQKSSEGKSTGKAFLNVVDKSMLAAVLKLSGSTLAGRTISIKEDSGPRPTRKSDWKESGSKFGESSSKLGGRWRDEKPRDSQWHDVGKGGKIEPATTEYRKKKWEKPEQPKAEVAKVESEEVPKERKKLELKPRSKPVGEERVTSSSNIFGNAKPRDEFAFQKRAPDEPKVEDKTDKAVEKAEEKKEEKNDEPEASVVRSRKVREPKAAAPVPVVEVKKKVTKVAKNRFLVDSSSSEAEE